eukprot:scaffold153_cov347-Pavlova_lutheri.AAC.57
MGSIRFLHVLLIRPCVPTVGLQSPTGTLVAGATPRRPPFPEPRGAIRLHASFARVCAHQGSPAAERRARGLEEAGMKANATVRRARGGRQSGSDEELEVLTEVAAASRIGIQCEDGPPAAREGAEERTGALEEGAGLQPHRVWQ